MSVDKMSVGFVALAWFILRQTLLGFNIDFFQYNFDSNSYIHSLYNTFSCANRVKLLFEAPDGLRTS